MKTLKLQQTVKKDGEVEVSGLPYKKGQLLEIILSPHAAQEKRSVLTVGQFRKSGLIGAWKDRTDIPDSSAYSRELRETVQRRRRHDFSG